MVTDLATWAWLCDVYVMPEHRGGGLGSAVVRTLVEHPRRRRRALADARHPGHAHDLYSKLGYRPLDDPSRWMHRGEPNL